MKLPANFAKKYGPWAVVTGASSGIGAEFVKQLSGHKLNVVLVARRQEKLDSLASQMRETHQVQTKVVVADLSTEEGWRKVVSETEDVEVGLLVNNAGIMLLGSFFNSGVEDNLRLVSVNCNAVLGLAHAFCRQFADKQRGGMIVTSSMGWRPAAYQATYCATKSFASTLAVSLRSELQDKGVNILSFEPGLVASEMSKELGKGMDLTGVTIMEPDACVSEALRSLAKGKSRCTPGLANKTMVEIGTCLPERTRIKILRAIMGKHIDKSKLEYA